MPEEYPPESIPEKRGVMTRELNLEEIKRAGYSEIRPGWYAKWHGYSQMMAYAYNCGTWMAVNIEPPYKMVMARTYWQRENPPREAIPYLQQECLNRLHMAINFEEIRMRDEADKGENDAS
jgi:hypothetical protein